MRFFEESNCRTMQLRIQRLKLLACVALLANTLAACSAPPPITLGEQHGQEYALRGRELVQGLAACGFCHGLTAEPDAALAGGRRQYDTFGELRAANLTPAASGLADWKSEEIVKALRAAKGPGDKRLAASVHKGAEWLSDEDAYSIAAYLKSLAPYEQQVERREISFIDANTKGLVEPRPEVRGFVPVIDSKFQVEYGAYLVDHVARCVQCHNSPGGLIANEKYLAGGQALRIEDEERVAPGLSGSKEVGLGEWRESDIERYLETGATPSGRISNPNFCPTRFYARAAQDDRKAIARYLKTLPVIE